MRSIDARETLPSLGIEGETGHSRHTRQGRIDRPDRSTAPHTPMPQSLAPGGIAGSARRLVRESGGPARCLPIAQRTAYHHLQHRRRLGEGSRGARQDHLAAAPHEPGSAGPAVRSRRCRRHRRGDRARRARLHPDQPRALRSRGGAAMRRGGRRVRAGERPDQVAQDRPNGAGPSIEHETSAFQRLTPREGEVLARLRQGKPNKIIAHELEITENTVKVFVRRILLKLHASNRTQLALLTHGQSAGAQPNGTS